MDIKNVTKEKAERKIDSLGRISLPKSLRNRFNVSPGSNLEFMSAVGENYNYIIIRVEKIDEQEEEA